MEFSGRLGCRAPRPSRRLAVRGGGREWHAAEAPGGGHRARGGGHRGSRQLALRASAFRGRGATRKASEKAFESFMWLEKGVPDGEGVEELGGEEAQLRASSLSRRSEALNMLRDAL